MTIIVQLPFILNRNEERMRKMEMKRCAKGHFFDSTKYTTCPYCSNNNEDNDKTMAVMPEEIEKFGNTVALGENNQISFDSKMEDYQYEEEFERFDDLKKVSDDEDDKTEPMDFEDFLDEKERKGAVDITAENSDFFGGEWDEPTTPDDIEDILNQENYPGEEVGEDAGKTIGIFSTTKVVGWLVCIKGPEKGKDFVLGSGRNFIGRSPSMDVSLMGDVSISRENHAVVTYNPRGNNFSISYGTGHGIVYLNGVEVLAPMKLEPYDRIELGETILSFIPFCTESFRWEEK